MNRRTFFQLSAAGAVCFPALHEPLLSSPADAPRANRLTPLRAIPGLLRGVLASPSPFPVVEPIFGGQFLPGGSAAKLITATSFSDFSAQVAAQASSGFRIAAFTALRTQNSTFYYAALETGSANYQLIRTTDANQFQQTFAANQAGYRLLDFAITWEAGQIAYVGYWLAVASPVKQTLVWGLEFSALAAQWNTLSAQSMRMARVQGFPQQDKGMFSAVFEPGSGGNGLWSTGLPQFPADVLNKFTNQSLVGLAFDPVAGNMVGCWRDKVNSAQFVWNQDWNTLAATAQQMATQGLILRSIVAYPNAPDFDTFFAANLAPYVMGYAYAVGKNGQVVAAGSGMARSARQPVNPNVPMTPDTRINLASVSKALTGIGVELLLHQKNISLDAPFWPFISSMVPNPDPGVKTVTIRNLVTMKSGFQTPPNEGPNGGNLWPYLNTYLAMPLVGKPGVTYSYNNENFTTLRGVMEQISGQDYVAWMTQNVLVPAGIDPSIVNPVPDPSSSATLTYSGPADTLPGAYWNQATLDFVAPGGWIATANQLLKILFALRGTSVLTQAEVSELLTGGIGWFSYDGNFGTYYHKNGGLGTGATPPQTLNTCIIRLTEGYDIVLLCNTSPPLDVVNLCCQAFDSRGLLTADAPPSIASAFHAAGYGAAGAPGSYCSVKGSGFTDQAPTDWSSSISGSGALPTSVGGISVRVNGLPAYVQYINPIQVNFLVPAKVTPGMAAIELITPTGVMTTTFQINSVAPGVFTYTLNKLVYPASVFATASGVTYVAPAGALPGYNSRPAAPGDIILLFATGCGPTNPVPPDGVVLSTVYPAANLAAFQVTIAGISAPVMFAGLVNSGFWQLNVQIPPGLPGGDQPLLMTVSGVPSQSGMMLNIQS